MYESTSIDRLENVCFQYQKADWNVLLVCWVNSEIAAPRVYDNAQANAVMQKAILIISAWENFSEKRKRIFLDYIEEVGSPLVDAYDPDPLNDDLQKATLQIRVTINIYYYNWFFVYHISPEEW